MAVQKLASKAKKSTKLDSLKNLVFGGANSSAKKGHDKSDKSHDKSEKFEKKAAPAVRKKINSSAKDAAHVASKPAPKAKAHSQPQPSKTQAKPKGKNASGEAHSAHPKKGSSSSVIQTGRLSVDSGETVCREVACEGLATTGGYCRLHYIKNWKKIKRKELILREKKLNQYIEELVAKYPDKYIEAIRQDLASDKDFAKVIYDLDLDEGMDDFEMEGGESVDSLIDTIKREFDDEGDAY